jgi:hypothetical protein
MDTNMSALDFSAAINTSFPKFVVAGDMSLLDLKQHRLHELEELKIQLVQQTQKFQDKIQLVDAHVEADFERCKKEPWAFCPAFLESVAKGDGDGVKQQAREAFIAGYSQHMGCIEKLKLEAEKVRGEIEELMKGVDAREIMDAVVEGTKSVKLADD